MEIYYIIFHQWKLTHPDKLNHLEYSLCSLFANKTNQDQVRGLYEGDYKTIFEHFVLRSSFEQFESTKEILACIYEQHQIKHSHQQKSRRQQTQMTKTEAIQLFAREKGLVLLIRINCVLGKSFLSEEIFSQQDGFNAIRNYLDIGCDMKAIKYII